MKVLIVDKLSPETVTSLQRLGLEVEVGKNLTAEMLPGLLAETDILVVRSTKVMAAAIEAAPSSRWSFAPGRGSIRSTWPPPAPGESTSPIVRARIRRPSRSWPSAC